MLTKEETSRRLRSFIDNLSEDIDLSFGTKMMIQQFLPFVPDVLQDEDQRGKLLSVLSNIAWVMGYHVQFEPEEDCAG